MSDDDKNKEIIIHKEVTSFSQFQCPILKSTNYTIWALRIKTILRANGLWETIEPEGNAEIDIKKDMATTAYLYQALPEDMILQVASCKSAKEIWEALQTRHVAKLNSIVTRASGLGSTFDQQTLVRKLLSSVPKRFIQIVAAIEQFTDLETTTLDETIGRLKTFEERINLFGENPSDNQDKLLFTNHDNSSSHDKGFRNSGQEKFRSSQDNKHDGKSNNSTMIGNPHISSRRITFRKEQKIIGKGDKGKEIFLNEKEIKPKKTDKGGEFTSREFTRYCKENGILKQLTAPYSPQQNGIVEKRNRSRDVKFKEDEGWDWKGYLDNPNPNKPEWRDFIISENYTSSSRIIDERNDEDSAPSPTQNNTYEYMSDDDVFEQPIENPSTPPPYTYEPNSEGSTRHTSSTASSSRPFDHTPVQGYRNISKIYNRAPEVQSDELLLLEEEPRNYKEAVQDRKWIEAMQMEIDSINKNKT
nr:putative zinc finger, CCHC-type [Tanacetum cinerariifolium]